MDEFHSILCINARGIITRIDTVEYVLDGLFNVVFRKMALRAAYLEDLGVHFHVLCRLEDLFQSLKWSNQEANTLKENSDSVLVLN